MKSIYEEEFHGLRRMFCITAQGKIEIAPSRTTMSHLEWFKEWGWINAANEERFLAETIRGFFSPQDNAIYCYKDVCFFFDEDLVKKVKNHLSELKKLLGLKDDTKVVFGPRDITIRGVHHPQRFEGILKVILNPYEPRKEVVKG